MKKSHLFLLLGAALITTAAYLSKGFITALARAGMFSVLEAVVLNMEEKFKE